MGRVSCRQRIIWKNVYFFFTEVDVWPFLHAPTANGYAAEGSFSPARQLDGQSIAFVVLS